MTTQNVYAARRDVYTYGLPRGTMRSPARLTAAALAATDTFELDGHGFETDDPIIFRVTDGGSLPAPIAANTTYYAIRVSDSLFQAAATQGGAAINLTTDGVSVVVAIELPFDEVLEFYSRWADSFLPAHVTPLAEPIPALVKGLVAELAAKKLQQIAGNTSVSVGEFEIAAKAQLERYANGLTLRDPNQKPANKAAVNTLVTIGTDSRGWGSNSLP